MVVAKVAVLANAVSVVSPIGVLAKVRWLDSAPEVVAVSAHALRVKWFVNMRTREHHFLLISRALALFLLFGLTTSFFRRILSERVQSLLSHLRLLFGSALETAVTFCENLID